MKQKPKMRWFRFYSEAMEDARVQTLPPDLFKTWVNLLCLVNRQEDRGVLPSLFDTAFALRMSEAETQERLDDLTRRGLLEATDRGIMPHKWDVRQPASDNVTERVHKHRYGQEADPTAGASETPRPVTGNVSGNDNETLQKRFNPVTRNVVDQDQKGDQIKGLTGAPPHLAVAAPAGERPRLRAESPPAHDARWDALGLALIEGTGTRPQTKSERTNHAAYVDQLWQLQPAVQADLVLTVCARYREEWPHISCTVKAILNHWGHFAKEEYAPPRQRKGQEEPGGEEARAYLLMRARRGQGEEPPATYEAQYTVRGD